jgi:small subunit ribosomal protein S21
VSAVFIKDGESVDSAIRRLKSKMDTEGTMEEVRRLQAYESPKEKRLRKLRSRLRREKAARQHRRPASNN